MCFTALGFFYLNVGNYILIMERSVIDWSEPTVLQAYLRRANAHNSNWDFEITMQDDKKVMELVVSNKKDEQMLTGLNLAKKRTTIARLLFNP